MTERKERWRGPIRALVQRFQRDFPNDTRSREEIILWFFNALHRAGHIAMGPDGKYDLSKLDAVDLDAFMQHLHRDLN